MSGDRKQREQEIERRRMLAAAFGDALPDQPRDECAEAWGEGTSPRGGAGDEDWLRRQVPPHHG